MNTGLTGRLAGAARFTPAPGGLHYTERGTLRFGAHHGTAAQSYWYGIEAPGVAPGVAVVRFADGRLFHPLDLTDGVADIGHDCAPDVYRGRCRVRGADGWTQVWLVRGPRKHLRIGTRFTRL